MAYTLSLLDKSPIPASATATQALANTLHLASRAEALGYKRFWVAEHHGNAELASSAPEILVAHILAKTSRIRVGSGGVLLQHYSPFKVAESFKMLSGLAPGRVDLGIGKAPGGLPQTTRALQSRHDKTQPAAFEALMAELDAHLDDNIARPLVSDLPCRFLLGGSPGSAALAAEHGWEFAYAGHFNGDPENIQRTVDTYRKLTGRSPLLALYAFVAPTSALAKSQVGALRIFKLHLATGQSLNLPTLEAAEAFARQAGVANYTIEEAHPHVISGSASDVCRELDDLSERYGIEEFVIDTPVADFDARNTSIELLATVMETSTV